MSTTPGFWKCVKCGTPNPGTVYITACVACGFPRPAPGFESLSGEQPRAEARPRGKPRPRALMTIVAVYGLVLMALFLLEWGVGDAWWPGFVLSMMPRAVFLIPLVPLGLWAGWSRRPVIAGAVVLEALFVAGPLMGFVVPWARFAGKPDGPTLRIMTLNRAGDRGFDVADFLHYLDRQKIDVVCFQEFGDVPTLDRVLAEKSWHRDKSKAIASRFPIVEDYPRSTEINEADGHYTALLYRVRLAGPGGKEFVVGCLHMPTSRYAFRRLFRLDTSAMEPYLHWWNSELLRMFELVAEVNEFPTLIGGDFNNGPMAGRLLEMRETGQFQSAFDTAGLGWGYTRPSKFGFVRIDHILANSSWTVSSCWTGPSFGSDHKSLVAEVALPASP
jgi:vancomycin resistance protein VanJ